MYIKLPNDKLIKVAVNRNISEGIGLLAGGFTGAYLAKKRFGPGAGIYGMLGGAGAGLALGHFVGKRLAKKKIKRRRRKKRYPSLVRQRIR